MERLRLALILGLWTLLLVFVVNRAPRHEEPIGDCRVYVASEPAVQGMGDLLERLATTFSLADALNATPVSTFEWTVPDAHSTSGGYEGVAERLGLRAHILDVGLLRASLPLLVEVSWVSPLNAAEAARVACFGGARTVLLRFDMDACPLWRQPWHALFVHPPSTWCPLDPRVPDLGGVLWRLRQMSAGLAVSRTGSLASLPVPFRASAQATFFSERAMNVALHIRTGDVCINCELVNTRGIDYRRLVATIELALTGCRTVFAFFSQLPLPWVNETFPDAIVVSGQFEETAHHLVSANILVTGGSSLAPMLAAFAGTPARPVVLEAMTKESSWGCHAKGCPGRTHILPAGAAVPLDRAGRMMDVRHEELRARIAASQPDEWGVACNGV